ncbi:hypothetical protein [Vibrio sp.]|uniref:hypothetical protein n=1 Tax=Vibrio sp. TaxID=678 RepID=UPI0031202C8E
MKLSTLSALTLFTFSVSIHANTTIDFIYPKNNGVIDKTMQVYCSVGSDQFSGSQLEKAVRFNVLEILANSSFGSHHITCNANYLSNSYEIRLSAVKFNQGEYGSFAPNYDSSGFATGVKLTQQRSACYKPDEYLFDETCLNNFYGTKNYYLEGILGPTDTQLHFDHSYSSSVGVFLLDNPQN